MPVPESVAYLDRRLQAPSSGISASYSSGTNTTTWTLPYSVAVDGTEGDLRIGRIGPGTLYTSTRPAANQIAVAGQGDLTLEPVVIGVLYPFTYRLSTIYRRDGDGLAYRDNGRLSLRRLIAYFDELLSAEITVYLEGGQKYSYTKSLTTMAAGSMSVPVNGVNERTRIDITSTGAGPCSLSEVEWEATFGKRR